ncbi:HAMP domain-containing sensor histidine kinase [Lentzea sp. NPDC005914]|uniref:sensor histidine kinase n=1 Tax=Lentzea sp. NPDC005914 TaxID=3154572 RepID=UPI0033EBA80D
MQHSVFPRARWVITRPRTVYAEATFFAIGLMLLWWQGDRLDHMWTDAAGDVFTLLALASACVATAAAIVARMIPRSVGETGRRLAGPLVFYGVIMIPATVFDLPNGLEPAIAISGFVASGLFLALMTWALCPDLYSGIRWPTAVVLAVGVTVVAGVVAQVVPVAANGRGPALATVVVVLGWFVVAAAFVVVGAMRQQPVTWRVGFGLTVIALAHVDKLALRPELAKPDLDFGVLRLVGLLLVLTTLARPALRAMHEVGDHAERLAAAERVARELASDAAERNHEIRNLVSGLSGVSHVLGERTPLGSAVHAELERVRYLLGHAASQDGVVHLAPLLRRLAALHRARGTAIELRVEESLRTAMPAPELAQVVTNLLVNCERHAAGSQVRILAGAHGDRVWIEVSDDGPGYRPNGHRGIGLRVCTRLLSEHGGTLGIGSDGDGRGCVALLHLPGASVRAAEAG